MIRIISTYNNSNKLKNMYGFFHKINTNTRKDHFLPSFIDQMVEKLVAQYFYYFLDCYSCYNQIVVALKDQENTIFTYLFGNFAFRRMPFELPVTFQRCLISIFL